MAYDSDSGINPEKGSPTELPVAQELSWCILSVQNVLNRTVVIRNLARSAFSGLSDNFRPEDADSRKFGPVRGLRTRETDCGLGFGHL